MKKILVTGALGQIGSELIPELRKKYGKDNVIAVGHHKKPSDEFKNSGPFEIADSNNKEELRQLIEKYNIDTIFHLVGILSAVGEKNPNLAWDVNMTGLKNMLDLAVEYKIERMFWPSSIAAFGPTTPLIDTPQKTVLEPTTMYGVTKVSGELLCQYYFVKYGLDVRSIRYPGIISWKTPPGGGTTDYAVAIYYDAVKNGSYDCFVNEKTVLPMMYMNDSVRATLELMEAPKEKITVRTAYNLTAISFSAKELSENVAKYIPNFKCTFTPDSRQAIADSWPKTIDDSKAREDWNWKPDFDLDKISVDMIKNLKIISS
ncbi:MAG TPA: NAD-dependent epimerase/dehydratase family protein [Candidatus Paceibacterota bacterium]|nr:NAD-dependent epimerase/dehydratase family protein [Candidatus Paceibacterota bacterium]HPT17907.1 NAD-dependent epimerase/dehydratase family protein [Candidatus Paceibacterota bacterium]